MVPMRVGEQNAAEMDPLESAIRWLPNSRAPVPQSSTRRLPAPFIQLDAGGVAAVVIGAGPGAAIDPRVPRNADAF